MALYVLYVLVAGALTVHGFNRTVLTETPRAKAFFYENKYAGLWYVQARLSPTSWPLPSATDLTTYYKVQPDRRLLATEAWRVAHCNYITNMFTPSIMSGVYSLKDSIGDILTGAGVVVETDYVTYAVQWACAKMRSDGTCGDPYVVVQTRAMAPSPFTMLTAETVLNLIWKLPLKLMVPITHKTPCDENFVRGQRSSPCSRSRIDTVASGQTGLGTVFPTGQQYASMSPFNQMSMYGLLDGLA